MLNKSLLLLLLCYLTPAMAENKIGGKVEININTGNIINIANGYKTTALISIGSLKNSQADKVDSQIYIQDIYNISSGQEQTNTVIIGYRP